MATNSDSGEERPPMNGPRRWARRTLLSALAGGGLTAVGLGGPLSGGALAAEPTSGAAGPAEGGAGQAAPATPSAETTSPPGEQQTVSPSPSSSSTASTPSSTSTTPPPAGGPPAPSGEGDAPTVVVQQSQKRTRARRHRSLSKTGSTLAPAPKGTVPAGTPGTPASTPPGTPNGVAPPPLVAAGQSGTLASVLGQSAVSAQALDFYRIPLFLLPIYQAAGVQYGVPWQILAAINEVETNYGTDRSVSTAGAVGWMQFMPETWMQYGVDALAAGYADPYNPVDAIFAAARYLHAAGASADLHRAILAYNHSEAYVSSVLLRAKLIAGYPESVVATLTGLVQGRMPVAGARVAPDASSAAVSADSVLSPASSTASTVPVAPSPTQSAEGVSSPVGAEASPSAGAKDPQLVGLVAHAGAAVLAVQDGRVVKLGRSRKLGRYLALRDIYGDVFTYAGLGSIAPSYRVKPHRRKPRSARTLNVTSASGAVSRAAAPGAAASGAAAATAAHDPAPRLPASAGHQPVTLHVKAPTQHKAEESEALPAADSGAAPPGMGKVRLYAHPDNPVAHEAAVRTGTLAPQGDSRGGRWLPLRLGSVVSQGTVLGHLASVPEIPTARLRFAIRPAGDRRTVDPRPILANWRELDAALHPKGAKATPNLLGATAAEVFLMSKSELERTVLSDPGVDIYQCGRQDISSGAIDSRVLATLAFLSRSGLKPTVSALRCGHGEYTTSGNVSEHYFGDAVDIAAVNGIPIVGHQGPGSITDLTIRTLLTLKGEFVPHQIISLMQYPGAANTLALPDHYNHIHVGFHPRGTALQPFGSSTVLAAHSAATGKTAPAPSPLDAAGELSAAQWEQLIARIGALPTPTIDAKPSGSAIRDPQAAQSNHDLGTRVLPLEDGEE